MPGPARKAQRTKGNLKPSSSSQAVQLLAQSGHSPAGFIGFSNQPAYVPASEIFDDVDATLDADFRLVLRKFSKKDTITKIKALQEFSSLCGSKDDDCIKSVLPFWPRIYNKVAIDVDHKVRELSQKALLAIAEKVGKNLSSQLRSIMGTWMVSMCDTYPTVASAANSAFGCIFPPAKQTAAIRFCKTECAEHFLNNVIKQTPQSLSDPLTTSEEDMTGKYHRVVSCSFQAMRKLITALMNDTSDLDFLTTHLSTLLKSSAFWKHAKSSNSIVNGGTLSILSSICQHCPCASGPFVSKISPLVFSYIDSKDPVIASYSWEALLSLINVHDDCWQHINWQKAVWPKLKAVLESGCCGHADIIGPCLLPLLSKLPQKNLLLLFDAFRLGLSQESLVNSPSAMSAFIKAFMECIHYSIKTSDQAGEGNNNSMIQTLMQDQVLVVVEASLTDSKSALAKCPMYSLLSPLVSYLGNNHPDVDREFWKDLSSFIRQNLLSEMNATNTESGSEATDHITQSSARSPSMKTFFTHLSLFIQALVFQEPHKSEIKKEKVTFAQEDVSNKGHFALKKEKRLLSPTLENLISDILVTSFYLATEFETSQYFQLFKSIAILHIPVEAAKRLNNGDDHLKLELSEDLKMQQRKVYQDSSKEIDMKLKALYKKDEMSSTTSEFTDFLYTSVLKFILYEQSQSTTPNLVFIEDLIVSAFALLQYLNDEEGIQFLSIASEALSSSSSVMCLFIEHLIKNVKTMRACAKALETSVINNKIAELATEAGVIEKIKGDQGDVGGIWKMLSSFVSHLDEGPFVSSVCVDAVINSCNMTLVCCHEKKIKLSSHSFSGLMTVICILCEKGQIKGHVEFSELLSNVLCIALESKFTNDETSGKLETVLSTVFHLIMSDCDGENAYLHQVCGSISKWVRSSHLKTLKDLEPVVKTVGLLVSTYERTCEEADSECPKDVNENILDNLLHIGAIHVVELAAITKELYIKGTLFESRERNLKDSKEVMSLDSFAFLTLYNWKAFKQIHGMTSSNGDAHNCSAMTKALSVRELNCFIQITEFLFLLDSAQKNGFMINKEVTRVVVELQNEVVEYMSSMTQRQTQALVNTAIISSESSPAVTSLGLRKCLVDLLHSERDIHSKRSISDGQQCLQTTFIKRCMNRKEKADGIIADLNTVEVWHGKDIIKAFTETCSFMLESEEWKLSLVSECLFGFVHLFSKCETISNEDRSAFFHQTLCITKWLKEKDVHLLTGSDSDEKQNADLIQYNICIARALTMMPVYQLDEYWEFILCMLVELIQFLVEVTVTKHSSLKLQALMASACHLAHFVAHTMTTAHVIDGGQDVESVPTVAVHQKTKTEWEEFFSEGVFTPLLSRFAILATQSSLKSTCSRWWTSVLDSLASAVTLCPAVFILTHNLPARLTASDASSIPDNMKTLLNHMCPLLNSRLLKVQIAAFHVLTSVMEDISVHEAKVVESNKDDSEEGEARSPPEALSVMVEAGAVSLDPVLMTQDIEAASDVEIGSQEHCVAMGYLLAWSLQLHLFKCSSNELRAKYAQFFKTHDSVSHLCDHLFRLMPSYPPQSMLEFQLALDGTDEISPSLLGGLAINVYSQCLEVLPALVRTWWVDQNRKSSNFVDKFTTQYISNGLCVQQLTSSDMTTASIEDITIRPRPAAREVSAIYEMAEVTVNMTIKLPDNYPLGKVDVSCDKRVGVSQAQWDKWLLQLNIFLQHQNGSIVEGLKLWKGNIDKKFEGIDDCMICFSVIHGTTFQLPRLTCRTCKKKFHSSCLYKWFNTSQKSSCPLCRNLF